jgi:hypothetical protein
MKEWIHLLYNMADQSPGLGENDVIRAGLYPRNSSTAIGVCLELKFFNFHLTRKFEL